MEYLKPIFLKSGFRLHDIALTQWQKVEKVAFWKIAKKKITWSAKWSNSLKQIRTKMSTQKLGRKKKNRKEWIFAIRSIIIQVVAHMRLKSTQKSAEEKNYRTQKKKASTSYLYSSQNIFYPSDIKREKHAYQATHEASERHFSFFRSHNETIDNILNVQKVFWILKNQQKGAKREKPHPVSLKQLLSV